MFCCTGLVVGGAGGGEEIVFCPALGWGGDIGVGFAVDDAGGVATA